MQRDADNFIALYFFCNNSSDYFRKNLQQTLEVFLKNSYFKDETAKAPTQLVADPLRAPSL